MIKNAKALEVIDRVRDKLSGNDFRKVLFMFVKLIFIVQMVGSRGQANAHLQNLDVKEQVSRLIKQATSHENLCQSYLGWCPFF